MTVFANGLEVSAKKQGCKVIAAFPDTCFTLPQTPATPPGVPIPYPNFATDSDLASGSGTVKIKGGEVSQENSSKFSKVTGDEAGSAPKKGIITSNKGGPAYAKKWSMDVKVEGKGVVRFSDLATTNHACDPGDDAPYPIVGKPSLLGYADSANCLVGQYDVIKDACSNRGGQAHHIIPDEYIRKSTRGSAPLNESLPSIDEGCSVCVGGFASGSTVRESNPTKAKGVENRQAVIDKAESHAAATGGTSLADTRGHGFLHQFDDRFREATPSIENALNTANDLLDEIAVYEDSVIDEECAKIAKQCIEKQFSKAKKEEQRLNKKRKRSSGSKNRRAKKLRL